MERPQLFLRHVQKTSLHRGERRGGRSRRGSHRSFQLRMLGHPIPPHSVDTFRFVRADVDPRGRLGRVHLTGLFTQVGGGRLVRRRNRQGRYPELST